MDDLLEQILQEIYDQKISAKEIDIITKIIEKYAVTRIGLPNNFENLPSYRAGDIVIMNEMKHKKTKKNY